MSELEARTVHTLANGKPDPKDWGTIDATTLGRGQDTFTGIPEAGAGTQGTPYQMTGWRNIKTGHVAPSNAFTATLTNLKHATLDTVRMGLSTGSEIRGDITTDGPATLVLTGSFGSSNGGCACTMTFEGNSVILEFAAAGTYGISIA